MKCADEGFIQSFLDGECTSKERESFLLHVKQCERCSRLQSELSALEALTRKTLEKEIFNPPECVRVDTQAAWNTFSQRIQTHKDTSVFDQKLSRERAERRSWRALNKKTKRWVTGTSVAAVLLASLSFPQVQAAASDFLSIFRMDKVQFVKVTQRDLQEVENWISSRQPGEMELDGIGKIWIEQSGTQKESNHYYGSREEAQKAGVKLPDLPKDMAIDSVELNYPVTIQLEINTEKANKLLSQLQVDAHFDEKLNGKRFSMSVPEATSIWIGSGENSMQYMEIGAPELKAPNGVDLEQLRSTLLALPFIPDQVKKQMISIKDWQHTLPIPYVTDKDSKLQELKVNGQEAVLITDEHRSQLIWQHEGHIRRLEGSTNMSDKLVAMAKQIK